MLHEKKISELQLFQAGDDIECPEGDISYVKIGGYCDRRVKENLREWAIAVVKECKSGLLLNVKIDWHPIEHINGQVVEDVRCGTMIYGKIQRCPICKFIIDCFEITQEELE